MNQMLTEPMPTRTDYLRKLLRKLKINQAIRVARDGISPREQQAWYHAARVEDMKVSVKTTPNGTYVWRVK